MTQPALFDPNTTQPRAETRTAPKGRPVVTSTKPDDPIVSHWGYSSRPHIALCGARLIGVKAPHDHPHKCDECERLHLEWLASR